MREAPHTPDGGPCEHQIIAPGIPPRPRPAHPLEAPMPYCSGPAETNVTRVKVIERQMYGRAGFPLLRKRVLLNY